MAEGVIHYTEELDKEFLKVDFYKKHNEYLPYIGKKYLDSKTKVLLVDESHYISNDWRSDECWKNYDKLLTDWTNEDWKKIFKPSTEDNDYISYFNTRKHANRSISDACKREIAISNLIQNPLKCIYKENWNEFSAENIAFINFFQYPSIYNGKTVWYSVVNSYKQKKRKKPYGMNYIIFHWK